MVVCLLKEPKRNVTVDGIKFTPSDIKGLLVKVIHSLPFKFTWLGRRYPDGPRGDPRPKEVFQKLKEWQQFKIPVVVDVDNGPSIWNFPFSKFTFDFVNRIMEMTSEGFPEQNRKYIFEWNQNAWIQETRFGESKNPDFLWLVQAEHDLYQREHWPQENINNSMAALFNPLVSPRKVFDIYIRSIEAE
mmetsp:Transcript_7041/g.26392  ORF Transcript_7041/g.26392 Transcript_7041/m.26392 type:complete len:188 (-) Transcript_7041:1052-1615(-)